MHASLFPCVRLHIGLEKCDSAFFRLPQPSPLSHCMHKLANSHISWKYILTMHVSVLILLNPQKEQEDLLLFQHEPCQHCHQAQRWKAEVRGEVYWCWPKLENLAARGVVWSGLQLNIHKVIHLQVRPLWMLLHCLSRVRHETLVCQKRGGRGVIGHTINICLLIETSWITWSVMFPVTRLM